MHNPRKNTRGALVPVAIAVVVAVIGTAALFVLEFGAREEVTGNGISMITATVVERAGATAYPTAVNFGADQSSLRPVTLHQASRHQRPAVDQHEEDQLERK